MARTRSSSAPRTRASARIESVQQGASPRSKSAPRKSNRKPARRRAAPAGQQAAQQLAQSDWPGKSIKFAKKNFKGEVLLAAELPLEQIYSFLDDYQEQTQARQRDQCIPKSPDVVRYLNPR